jgi:hypothetical protein
VNPNPPAGSFSGELGVLGLFDLGQLLMLNGATGCLVVHCGSKRGFLYFTSGRLVNAVDDTYAQGESAAYQIFGWKSGAFQFRPEPPTGSTTIQNSTESVMLEAARLMDEASLAAGAAQGSKATERLSERQVSLEALRDVFRQVTNEASGASVKAGAGPSPTLHLYELERPGDRLVYRPGHPPRMRQADVWRETAEPPFSLEDYRRMRAYLLDVCRPAAEEGAEAVASNEGLALPVADGRAVPPASRTLSLADGRSIALDLFQDGPDESLWLRPVAVPAPDPSNFKGSLDRLQQVLGITQGLVLVGGPDLDSARQMLHAVIALLLGDASESLLLVSEDRTYQHRENAGVFLRAEPRAMRGVLRAVHPDIVALDPALGRGDVTLDDLEIVPRVIASAVVSDPAALVARWLIRVGHDDFERAQVSLATTPIGLVMAYPGALDQDSLAFNAWILSERERSLALRGETGTLSPLLQQATARLRQERRKKAA